jgi:hypothetical protein
MYELNFAILIGLTNAVAVYLKTIGVASVTMQNFIQIEHEAWHIMQAKFSEIIDYHASKRY